MPSRRSDIQMDPTEQSDFLATQPYCVLATIGPSGHPHQVTVGFALDGPECVVISSFRTAQKVINVKRDPRVSMLVELTQPYAEIRGVLMSGRASIVDDLDEVATWHHRLRERTAPLLPKVNLPPIDDEALIPKRVLIMLSVEKTVSWDHRKLGGVY